MAAAPISLCVYHAPAAACESCRLSLCCARFALCTRPAPSDLVRWLVMGCPAAPYWATASWSQVDRQRMSQFRVILLCPPFSFLVVSGSSFLVKADWPLLKHFEVSGISVSSMSALCKGSWPYLETLALTESRGALGFQGAAELVKGDWPCLTSLNLCNCDLDAASMNVIVEMSNWPLLASLDISYNYEHTS